MFDFNQCKRTLYIKLFRVLVAASVSVAEDRCLDRDLELYDPSIKSTASTTYRSCSIPAHPTASKWRPGIVTFWVMNEGCNWVATREG